MKSWFQALSSGVESAVDRRQPSLQVHEPYGQGDRGLGRVPGSDAIDAEDRLRTLHSRLVDSAGGSQMASYLFTFVTTPVPCIAVKTVGRIILDDFGDGFVFVEEFSPLEAILVTASADRIIDQVLASLAFAVTTERPLTLAHAIDLLVGQPAEAVTRALALATLRLCRGDRGRASQILQLGENDLLDLLQDGDAYSREMRGSL